MEPSICPTHPVHSVLAGSYLVFFISFLAGFGFDLIYPIRMIPGSFIGPGALLLFLSTILIYWAQSVSGRGRTARKECADAVTPDDFKKGPYRFFQSPTHLGLVGLLLAYGMLADSIIVIGSIFISAIVSYSIFIPREQRLLEQKYGDAYRSYKKSVSSFF